VKKLIPVFAVISRGPLRLAGGPRPGDTLHVISALTNAQAIQRPPVSFEATVTYYRRYSKDLFVQDGIRPFLCAQPSCKSSFRATHSVHEPSRELPAIRDGTEITLLGHGPLPSPASPALSR